MKRGVLLVALAGAVLSATAAAAFVGSIGPSGATASSHREAPLIADDPAADNTDVYAFVSPDKPNTVTIIANYIPFEDPAGGPNYYRFDPDRRSTRSTSTTTGTRRKTSRTSSGSRRHGLESEHVPLQHGPGHVADGPGPEREADVHGDASRRQGLDR